METSERHTMKKVEVTQVGCQRSPVFSRTGPALVSLLCSITDEVGRFQVQRCTLVVTVPITSHKTGYDQMKQGTSYEIWHRVRTPHILAIIIITQILF